MCCPRGGEWASHRGAEIPPGPWNEGRPDGRYGWFPIILFVMRTCFWRVITLVGDRQPKGRPPCFAFPYIFGHLLFQATSEHARKIPRKKNEKEKNTDYGGGLAIPDMMPGGHDWRRHWALVAERSPHFGRPVLSKSIFLGAASIGHTFSGKGQNTYSNLHLLKSAFIFPCWC